MSITFWYQGKGKGQRPKSNVHGPKSEGSWHGGQWRHGGLPGNANRDDALQGGVAVSVMAKRRLFRHKVLPTRHLH